MSTKMPAIETRAAEIVREYGPYPGAASVHGVTFDGQNIWFAKGDGLAAFDPASGELRHQLDVSADAGTAFDGQHLWQIADAQIQKVDPQTGRVLATIPAPSEGRDSGLAWAEGTLWVGEYRARKIHQIDPATGAVLRSLTSDRFVTGVSWVDGQLWHGTLEGDESELRQIDPNDGEVLERLELPKGLAVTGLEAGPDHQFFCGGGTSGKVRAVRRPTLPTLAGALAPPLLLVHERVGLGEQGFEALGLGVVVDGGAQAHRELEGVPARVVVGFELRAEAGPEGVDQLGLGVGHERDGLVATEPGEHVSDEGGPSTRAAALSASAALW